MLKKPSVLILSLLALSGCISHTRYAIVAPEQSMVASLEVMTTREKTNPLTKRIWEEHERGAEGAGGIGTVLLTPITALLDLPRHNTTISMETTIKGQLLTEDRKPLARFPLEIEFSPTGRKIGGVETNDSGVFQTTITNALAEKGGSLDLITLVFDPQSDLGTSFAIGKKIEVWSPLKMQVHVSFNGSNVIVSQKALRWI